MTAPMVPTAPTWPDLTLTAQVSQYNQAPQDSVLAAMAFVPVKAAQAEINETAFLRNSAYTRP